MGFWQWHRSLRSFLTLWTRSRFFVLLFQRVEIPTPPALRPHQDKSSAPPDSPVPEPLERHTLSEEFLAAQDQARESARKDREEQLRVLALRIAEGRETQLISEEQLRQDRAAKGLVAKLRKKKEGEISYYRGDHLAIGAVQMQSCLGSTSHRLGTSWGRGATTSTLQTTAQGMLAELVLHQSVAGWRHRSRSLGYRMGLAFCPSWGQMYGQMMMELVVQ